VRNSKNGEDREVKMRKMVRAYGKVKKERHEEIQ
jgi:hypothetical protein